MSRTESRIRRGQVSSKPLGIWSLVGAAFGAIIGSGWLLGAASAASIAGPASVIAWVIGGVAMLVIALVMVEVGSLLPKSGGVVWWPFHSSGRLVGTVVAAGVLIFYAANPPSEAIAMVKFANGHLESGLTKPNGDLTITGYGWALAFMIVFVLLNMFGVAWFARVNTVVTISKFVVPVLTVVLLGLSFRTQNFTSQSTSGFNPYGWNAVFSALISGGVIYAYGGFQAPLDHAGEARSPRDVRRAVILSILLCIVIYTALQVVFIGATPAARLSDGWTHIHFNKEDYANSPYMELAATLNLTWLSWLLRVESLSSPAGSALVFTSAMAQEVAQFGLNRIMPHWLADRSGRREVLGKAMAINLAIGAMLLSFGGWEQITAVSAVCSLFVYAMAAIPYSAFRQQARIAAVMRWRLLAPCSFVLATLIVYGGGWAHLWRSVGSMTALALLLYAFRWHVPDARRADDLRAGLWLLGYFAALLLLSGLVNELKVIPQPVGILLAIALGAGAYAQGVRDARSYLRRYPVAFPVTKHQPGPD
jgi:amino acid transporter